MSLFEELNQNNQNQAEYTVESGDIWKLAEEVYGDGTQWTKIYEANRGVIGNNPNLIRPDQELVIPGINGTVSSIPENPSYNPTSLENEDHGCWGCYVPEDTYPVEDDGFGNSGYETYPDQEYENIGGPKPEYDDPVSPLEVIGEALNPISQIEKTIDIIGNWV